MKVYVVMAGRNQEDYHVDRIFTNKQKAEEYEEWLEFSYGIEEHEINDDVQFEKYYVIDIILLCRCGGEQKITTKVDKAINVGRWNNHIYLDKFSLSYDRSIKITLRRTVESENFDQDYYVDKFTKVVYDILDVVKQKLSEGYDASQINEMIEDMKI